MEKIPIKDLQNLANILHQEGNLSKRNQLQAWVTASSGNPDHASLSSLASMAQQSGIKDQILSWISSVTNPKPTYSGFIPDIPAQMEEEIKSPSNTEEDAIQIGESTEIPLDTPPSDSGEVEQGIPESEEPAKEGEIKSEEKVKKPRKKKTD